MLNREKIKELSGKYSAEGDVITCVLNIDISQKSDEHVRKEFKEYLSQIDKQLGKGHSANVKEIYDATDFSGKKTILIIASKSLDLFEVFALTIPLVSSLTIDARVNLIPLIRAVDDFERYAFVLVSKESMRLFAVYLGEVEENEDFYQEVQGRHKKGGWSQARFERHTEDEVQKNMKTAAKAVHSMLKKKTFDRLIVAGPSEVAKQFEQLLHNDVKSRVVGSVSCDPSITNVQIVQYSMECAQKAERAAEAEIVSELVNSLGEGNRAVRGAQKVLDAAIQGKVMKVVMDARFEVSGMRCKESGEVALDGVEGLNCNGERETLKNISSDILSIAIQGGAEVELVTDNELIKENKSIGAFLRF